MVVGVMQVELFIHGAKNLKAKRAVVKSLIGRCRARFPVSCAEVGHRDLWQRTTIGFTIIEKDEASADRILQKVIVELERSSLAEIIRQDMELIHY